MSRKRDIPEGSAAAPSILELNLKRLNRELAQYPNQRKIGILGQPGSGKSTLLDVLTDRNCVPRPLIGQRTDATHWGTSLHVPLLHHYKQQYVFVDAPGYDTHAHPVSVFFKLFPFRAFDALLIVLKGKVHQADDQLWLGLVKSGLAEKTLVARSFSDSLNGEEAEAVSTELRQRFGGHVTLFSNREKTGLDEIKRFLGMGR